MSHPDLSSLLGENASAEQLLERFSLLAENLPASFWLIDVAGRRVVYANPAYDTLWGASREELFRDRFSWLEHVHPEDRERLRLAVSRQRYGGLDEQMRILRPDGQVRWLHLRSFAVGSGERPHSVGGMAFDVTPLVEHRLALDAEKAALQRTADLQAGILDAVAANVAIVDPDGVIIAVNAQWRRFAEDNGCLNDSAWVGSNYFDVCSHAAAMGEQTAEQVGAGLRQIMDGLETGFTLTYPCNSPDKQRWFQLMISSLRGASRGAVVMHLDVSASVQAEAKIKHLAHFDGVTGLPNRPQFIERFREWLAHGERHEHRVTVFFVAIDNFKAINDAWGYAAGDHMLQVFSERLRSTFRPTDVVGRLGGDCFGVVLAEDGGIDEISHAARRVLDLAALPVPMENETLHPTASIGIALFPQDGTDADHLLQGAETALFRAREKGRNTYEFAEAALNERVRFRQKLEVELRRALAQDEFVLHFQPKTSCRSGNIVGAEVLLRWHHPQRGLLPPGDFIPVLEDSGLIVPVGAWVLKAACAQAAAWMNEGLQCVPLAVNLSARQLRGDGIVELVREVLAASGVPPHLLELELTESMLMENVDSIIPTLQALKALGVRLSVDDFGTGYSSLSYLKQFPLDALKVDRSFVQDITADPNDASITRAIITMAHALKLKVIAEGVETEGQLGLLIANHCDEIQGYYFSRPVAAAGMQQMLKDDSRLPEHLLRVGERQRTLLLVDDEENILAAMKRLLRREGYSILTANSGAEGLEVLARNEVDVILSDQRMPGMTGVEFLRRAKDLYPNTVRVVLSGYTELQSVTSAINEGAIYKFLTKPWDDDQLRANIAEAFRRKDLGDENRRLAEEIRIANHELAEANIQLKGLLGEKQQQIVHNETALEILHEVLQLLPWPLVGVDDQGMIASVNDAAEKVLGSLDMLLGMPAVGRLPDALIELMRGGNASMVPLAVAGTRYRALCRQMGLASSSRGRVLILLPEE
ncbi:MAG TPA: EAL domain-containing protein [Rhodocyclaceae bacterium]